MIFWHEKPQKIIFSQEFLPFIDYTCLKKKCCAANVTSFLFFKLKNFCCFENFASSATLRRLAFKWKFNRSPKRLISCVSSIAAFRILIVPVLLFDSRGTPNPNKWLFGFELTPKISSRRSFCHLLPLSNRYGILFLRLPVPAKIFKTGLLLGNPDVIAFSSQ